MGRFSAQVGDWVLETEARLLAVFKASAQELFSIAQTTRFEGGNLPIDTGFLRNSLVSGLNGSTSLSGPDSYVIAIAGAAIGDSVIAGWTAEYARRMEYGFVGQDALGRYYNQRGFGYVRGAAVQWQQIVDRNAARIAGAGA
jgi:hypothetical protein